MAEDLDDGEFWLPSQFLTDDDILMDFDLDFTSTESDEDDIRLARLTHQTPPSHVQDSSCPVHSKGLVLSSSPQSTLCGCMCNHSSSRESRSGGPVSPPQPPPEDKENKEVNFTLDLLNKAAGEVARLKLKTEKKTGTGFFDCSQKGVLYPAPIRNPDPFPPIYFQPHFHHFPPMMWAPLNGVQYNQPKQQPQHQQPPPPQNRATKNNNKSNNNNNNNNSNNNSNRPLGLPPSAWPPLQPQQQNPAPSVPTPPVQTPPVFVAPKREFAGTGVFLPRRIAIPTNETRKKSDANNTKTKSGKGSQSQSQSNHRRNSRTTISTANHNDIQLPQEWTY